MTTPLTPAQGALLAASAEAIFDPANPQRCQLEPWVAADYDHIGTLIARDALFGSQRLGIGAPVYFGFVVQHHHLGNYVVAIRGTELPIEWAEDADALFVPHPLGGLVERGFWSIYSSMTFAPPVPSETIATAARGLIDLLHDSMANVTVIGHSLGAPLAAYLALDLAAALGSAHSGSVNALLYASPKPGDGIFGHNFDTTVGHDNYAVYNYLRDVVPRLPVSLPFGLGFQALPNVNVIRPSTAKVAINNDLRCNHIASSYAALLGAPIQSGSPNTCIKETTP